MIRMIFVQYKKLSHRYSLEKFSPEGLNHPKHPGNAITKNNPTAALPAFKRSSEKSGMEQYLFTLGGRICCIRCNATSKRTNQQCMAPALKGKTKCRTHGGKSTGPRTLEGKARCAEAKTVHGLETRLVRVARGEAMKRLRYLEEVGYAIGLISGARIPGRKPRG
jgi:hypothetical protein